MVGTWVPQNRVLEQIRTLTSSVESVHNFVRHDESQSTETEVSGRFHGEQRIVEQRQWHHHRVEVLQVKSVGDDRVRQQLPPVVCKFEQQNQHTEL